MGLLELPDDAESTAAALAQVRADELEVGARKLALAAHWADLHPFLDAVSPVPGAPRPRRYGGHGTPEVSEFAADELGLLLGVHSLSAQWLMADALNLRHRHPRLWALVQARQVPAWVAVKTAREVAAAGLDHEQALYVDRASHACAATLPPSRYLDLVAAKIIEAAPALAEHKRQQAALERFVRTGRSTEQGLKTMIARATAAEIIYLTAMVDRLAQILALRGDTDSADVRRSKALGLLANPAQALQLLAWAEGQPAAETAAEPEPEPEPDPLRNDAALNAAIAAGLAKVAQARPGKLLPPATLHLHIDHSTWLTGAGVVRMEGVGPITVQQARELLGHSNVRVVPVVDLAGGMPVDCYEIPEPMRQNLTLRHPHEIFPWATRSSRRTDGDHTIPYVPPDQGGPPGQTHPDRLGPLTRRHHRLKTHSPRWRHHQVAPGVHLWRTPTGHWTRVDREGSHTLGPGGLRPGEYTIDLAPLLDRLAAPSPRSARRGLA